MASNVKLTRLAKDLAIRADSGKPVRIGLIGAGEMGTDIVVRTSSMTGVDVAAILEIDLINAQSAVNLAKGEEGHCQIANNKDELNSAIELGKVAITENKDAVLQSGLIDVVVDATGIPAVGAEIGLNAMQLGKHLVMMNVEADVTIGSLLRREAEKLGVVYSLGAGDEPSACMELIEFVTAMGHQVVCAGKGKNNPLNIDAIPDDYIDEANRRNMNPRLLVEFVDGSKTAVEMCALGNATGLIPDCDGMHGPAATLSDLATTLIPKKDGGLLADIGRVDFSTGKGVSPGVFVIVEAEHPRIWERLNDLKMGEGPYYTFHRPYHLTSLEVPLTCARAVLYQQADMVPLDQPCTEVCAVAKRDLEGGETLDQIGEYMYRAVAMTSARAKEISALSAGLLTGGKVKKSIKKGQILSSENTTLPNTKLVELRNQQNEFLNQI